VPTIPLYHSPTSPDAWHRVRAPGGYEWWHFDAEELEHDRRLIATFYDGYIFDPIYRRRYAQYLRHPTRHSPPLPSEFPCLRFTLFENGRTRFSTQFTAGEFRGSDDSPALTIGENRTEQLGKALRLTLCDQAFSAEITFTPKFSHTPIEYSLEKSHHWILADPLCDVDAKIQLSGETIEFRGRGFRDHRFGTEPPSHFIHGRVLLDDAACAFHLAESSTVLEADASGIRQVQLNEVLSLLNPRPLDSSLMIYDASWRGRKATALCEVNRFRDG
jgi:hypothetical protein